MLLVAVQPASVSCDRPAAGGEADSLEAVRAADAELQEAIAVKDLDRTVSFYAPTASMLPLAKPAVEGREAIREEWRSVFAIPGFKNTSLLTKLDASGDLAYTQGSYETELLDHESRSVRELGKWVSVWKRQADGSWKIVAEIYNTDTLPPDHQ